MVGACIKITEDSHYREIELDKRAAKKLYMRSLKKRFDKYTLITEVYALGMHPWLEIRKECPPHSKLSLLSPEHRTYLHHSLYESTIDNHTSTTNPRDQALDPNLRIYTIVVIHRRWSDGGLQVSLMISNAPSDAHTQSV